MIMENMKIYEAGRAVPADAIKPIKGGKLMGMSNINPMWRIKKLTELFGACGSGWGYRIMSKDIYPCGEETIAIVDIILWWMDGDKRCEVEGTGGSKLIALEKGKPVANDEAFKMALTDAISVASKALGIGADVYWAEDRTKYDLAEEEKETVKDALKDGKIKMEPVYKEPAEIKCEHCGKPLESFKDTKGNMQPKEVLAHRTKERFGQVLCIKCAEEIQRQLG